MAGDYNREKMNAEMAMAQMLIQISQGLKLEVDVQRGDTAVISLMHKYKTKTKNKHKHKNRSARTARKLVRERGGATARRAGHPNRRSSNDASFILRAQPQ